MKDLVSVGPLVQSTAERVAEAAGYSDGLRALPESSGSPAEESERLMNQIYNLLTASVALLTLHEAEASGLAEIDAIIVHAKETLEEDRSLARAPRSTEDHIAAIMEENEWSEVSSTKNRKVRR